VKPTPEAISVVGDGTAQDGRVRDTGRPVWVVRPVFMREAPKSRDAETGVTALVVAVKPGNAGGAKERRKVEA
jgi:hypothetical protein